MSTTESITDDQEVYVMNADGTGQTNLSNNGEGVYEESPDWGGR